MVDRVTRNYHQRTLHSRQVDKLHPQKGEEAKETRRITFRRVNFSRQHCESFRFGSPLLRTQLANRVSALVVWAHVEVTSRARSEVINLLEKVSL